MFPEIPIWPDSQSFSLLLGIAWFKILGHGKKRGKETEAILVFEVPRERKHFSKGKESREKMVPSASQGDSFFLLLSCINLLQNILTILLGLPNIWKEIKLKGIWIFHAYRKKKELIFFPFIFVNQTRSNSELTSPLVSSPLFHKSVIKSLSR